jgi:hypothetical protein
MQIRNSLPQQPNHYLPEVYTMKRILHLSLLSLATLAIALPASAGSIQGPRGNAATGSGAAVRNPQGGTSAAGGGSATGIRGGSATGQGAIRTNGQGGVTYKGGGSVTTPQGQTYSGSGSGSYSKDSGYAGSGSATVNGTTYQISTQGGTTQVSNGAGNTKVYQRPHR